MPTTCNRCGGNYRAKGQKFQNGKVSSVFRCVRCGAYHEVPWNIVGPNAFDIEHPDAQGHFLATPDWMDRELRKDGLLDGKPRGIIIARA